MHLVAETEHGRVAITSEAIAEIVGHVTSESYGVVGSSRRRGWRRLLTRDRPTRGVEVRAADGSLEIELAIVVEYGLNLAEVASTVRTRVAYEVTRLTGIPVAGVEVRIEDVRRGRGPTSPARASSPRRRSPTSRRTVAGSTTSTSTRYPTVTPGRTSP